MNMKRYVKEIHNEINKKLISSEVEAINFADEYSPVEKE